MAVTYIFDLDGTLYDKKGLKFRMILRSLKDAKPIKLLVLERSARNAISGIDTGTITYETLFESMASKSHKKVEEIRQWYNNWYMPAMVDEIRKHFPLRPGIKERLLSYKENGDKVAILSDYGFINEKLEVLGLDPAIFDLILDAPSIGGYKPAPGVFKTTLSLLGSSAEDSLMIGDRPERDGGSVKVGIRFLHIDEYMTK